MVDTPASVRLDSLTGLRWWAAFGVFLYHLKPSGAVGLNSSSFFSAGHTGVAFFFVLSGFVLTWSAHPGITIRQFWGRRFARIWPAHFVALLLAIPIFYSFSGPNASWWIKEADWRVFTVSFFLLQGFFTKATVLFGGNPAAWTLSCEVVFYAIFPFLFRGFRNLGEVALWVGTLLTLSAGVLIHLISAGGLVMPAVVSSLWQFLLGVFIALILKSGRALLISPKIVITLLLIIFIGSGIASASRFGGHFGLFCALWISTVLPVIYALAIWALASSELAGIKSVLNHRLMVKGGEWSYAFYLVHATVLYGYRELLGVSPVGVVAGISSFVIVFTISLALSGALHTFVERPCEKRIRAWSDCAFGIGN